MFPEKNFIVIIVIIIIIIIIIIISWLTSQHLTCY